MRTRIAFWFVGGPLGHLVAGVLDWVELLARHLWVSGRARVSRRLGGAALARRGSR